MSPKAARTDPFQKTIDAHKRAWERLEARDAKAKAAGEIVGRYIQESYADGHATYVILSETRSRVRIEVATGIGDDWILPAWGPATTIARKYAVESLRRRDALDDVFARHRKAQEPITAFAERVEKPIAEAIPGATRVRIRAHETDGGMNFEVEYEDGVPSAEALALVRDLLSRVPDVPKIRDLRVRRSGFSAWGWAHRLSDKLRTGVEPDYDSCTVPPAPPAYGNALSLLRGLLNKAFPPEEPRYAGDRPRSDFDVAVVPEGDGRMTAVVTWEKDVPAADVSRAIGTTEASVDGVAVAILLNRRMSWVDAATAASRGRVLTANEPPIVRTPMP